MYVVCDSWDAAATIVHHDTIFAGVVQAMYTDRCRPHHNAVSHEVMRTRSSAVVLGRKLVDLLLPYLTTLVNESLMQGRLPASQKHAIISPSEKVWL